MTLNPISMLTYWCLAHRRSVRLSQPRRTRSDALRIEPLESRLALTTLPAGFVETLITTNDNLTRPTAMQFSPTGQLWVLEQTGRAKVVNFVTGGTSVAGTLNVDPSGERGLLGLAFDSSYDGAGPNADSVYLYYTAVTPNVHNRVSRFAVNNAGSNAPTLGAETIIMEVAPEPQGDGSSNHNGGAIHFGIDGNLYIAIGDVNADGANFRGAAHVSQSLAFQHGKMLRIDITGDDFPNDANRNYAIPSDNPFIDNDPSTFDETWVLGLRNPYTFAVQPDTGRVFINDVGEGQWEEINDGIAGANYGWASEGTPGGFAEGFEAVAPSYVTVGTYRNPILAYDHTDSAPSPSSCAITGGTFYPASSQFGAAFAGMYFYADFCGNYIRTFDPSVPGSVGTPDRSNAFATNLTSGGVVDLKVDTDGNLYYLSREGTGEIYRISSTSLVITNQPDDIGVEQGQSASFSVAASSGSGLTYQWQRADSATPANFVNITGATSATFSIATTQTADSGDRFRVVVSSGNRSTTSNSATLTFSVANQIPTATIDATSSYSFGDTISFSANATDAEDGTLPNSAYRWSVDLGHDTHFHPHVAPITGIKNGTFVANFIEPDPSQRYRIYLDVTDSDGAVFSTFFDVQPVIVNLSIETRPSGILLTIDGQPVVGPELSVVGTIRVIQTPESQVLDGITYEFVSWSDGGTATHDITTPAINTIYVAQFRRPAVIAWSDPNEIVFGTSLSAAQLNATADVPGSFVYDPPLGMILTAGSNQELRVTFTPDDLQNYSIVTATANIDVRRQDFDYGDAPTANQSGFDKDYPVLFAQDGARHLPSPLFMGLLIDVEPVGRPDKDAGQGIAGGDDNDNLPDEDGVRILASVVTVAESSTTSSVQIVSSRAGKVDAWFDFNRDGDWDDSGEQILTSVNVNSGPNLLAFAVPAGASVGSTFARFRLSTVGGLHSTGEATDGEVEDYIASIITDSSTATLDIDAPAGETIATLDGDNLLVTQGANTLFQGPIGSFGSISFAGSSLDDIFLLTILESITNQSLQFNGNLGKDILRLIEAGQTLDLTNAKITVSDIEVIDITGTGSNKLVISVDALKALSTANDRLEIVSNADDIVELGTGFRMDLPQLVNGEFTHIVKEAASGGTAEVHIRNDRPFQNPLSRFDADRDGSLRALDALRIINAIARRGTGPLTRPVTSGEISSLYFDVSGNNVLTALDALQVINAIARIKRSGIPEGEANSLAIDLALFVSPQTEWEKSHNSSLQDVTVVLPLSDLQRPKATAVSSDLNVPAVDDWMNGFAHKDDPRSADLSLLSDTASMDKVIDINNIAGRARPN